MSEIEFDVPGVGSVSLDGVEYPAVEGKVSVPAIHAQTMKDQGFSAAVPPEGAVSTVIEPPVQGDEDPPVLIDGVEADRDALIAFLTAADQKPHPQTGDKKLREKVRAIQAAIAQ